jgi:hypothetical protein
MQFRPAPEPEVRAACAVQRACWSDRDCPLETAGDRCLWHTDGTAASLWRSRPGVNPLSAFPVRWRMGTATAGGTPQSGLGPSLRCTPSFKLCFRSSAPFVGVCDWVSPTHPVARGCRHPPVLLSVLLSADLVVTAAGRPMRSFGGPGPSRASADRQKDDPDAASEGDRRARRTGRRKIVEAGCCSQPMTTPGCHRSLRRRPPTEVDAASRARRCRYGRAMRLCESATRPTPTQE